MDAHLMVPAGYTRLNHANLKQWLFTHSEIVNRMGGSPETWSISEISDGNLNSVFAISGSDGHVCVKQALPYVRAIGAEWPMPVDRTYFEHLYLRTISPHVPGVLPSLYFYDADKYAMAIEFLEGHITLRSALINGVIHPNVCRQVAIYIANATFGTSTLSRRFEQVNDSIALFLPNHSLNRITIDLIFTHPYLDNSRNRWTTPQLDALVTKFRNDTELKVRVGQLAHHFLTDSRGFAPRRPPHRLDNGLRIGHPNY